MAGIVIGGSSCVGKTTVARQLSVALSVRHVDSDRMLPRDPAIQPLAGSIEIWDRPVQELCGLLVAAARASTPHLAKQAVALSKTDTDWILEGERVHPELVDQLQMDGLAVGVFVVEPSADRLHHTLQVRLPGFQSLTPGRQKAVAALDREYNLWLIREARQRQLAVVSSQPWESLGIRILGALEGARGRQTRG
jgi:2-phosphoglycerate kinase